MTNQQPRDDRGRETVRSGEEIAVEEIGLCQNITRAELILHSIGAKRPNQTKSNSQGNTTFYDAMGRNTGRPLRPMPQVVEDLRHARRTDRPPRRTRLLASASQSARIVALSMPTSSLDIFRNRKMPSRAMRTDHWAFPWVSFLATPSEFTNRFPEQLLDPGLLWTP